MNNRQAMQDALDDLKKKIDMLLEERDFLRIRVQELETQVAALTLDKEYGKAVSH